jgi:hypothetical protein
VHGKPPDFWNIIRDRALPVAELTGDNACLNTTGCNAVTTLTDWEKCRAQWT